MVAPKAVVNWTNNYLVGLGYHKTPQALRVVDQYWIRRNASQLILINRDMDKLGPANWVVDFILEWFLWLLKSVITVLLHLLWEPLKMLHVLLVPVATLDSAELFGK